MAGALLKKLESSLDAQIVGTRPLAGGDIADVSRLTLSDDRSVVAKRPRMDQPDTTAVEAMMLKHLKKHSPLPVPDVLYQAKGVLILSYIPHAGVSDRAAAARDVAGHVAALHAVRPKKGNRPFYGLEKDTYIGPLPQQNKPADNWCDFFTDNRLLAMAGTATRTGKLPAATMKRVEELAALLPDMLAATPPSSLLHGDLWAGNMLIDGDRAAGFIDPAISYGHAEMDLAFIDLMGGLDPVFFDAYQDAAPIEHGFFEERMAIYQLWPLLVHVRLFGGGYVGQVERILSQFGV